MPEPMYGPILLMTAFFGCVVLLMVMVTPLIYAGIDTGEDTTASRIHDVFDELMYEEWEPEPFYVTGDTPRSNFNVKSDPAVTFDAIGGTDFPLDCQLIRNASWPSDDPDEDFWVFWQNYGWLGMEVATEYITLDAIESCYDSVGNYSSFIINLRFTYQVIFWTNDTGFLPTDLWNNYYKMSVAVNLSDTMDSLSPWTMLGKIMTFRMPGTNFVTNALIAVPIYTTLLYIAFAIIRSIIPTLG